MSGWELFALIAAVAYGLAHFGWNCQQENRIARLESWCKNNQHRLLKVEEQHPQRVDLTKLRIVEMPVATTTNGTTP